MSGIIGSKHNIRGSGRIAVLGTDGQIMTSGGAGTSAVFEDAPAGATSWQSVQTSSFTAAAGNGYPCNTTDSAFTVTLPAGSVGDTIELTDYAGTWDSNNLTIDQDGSEKLNGATAAYISDTERGSIKLTYVDSTQGWISTSGADTPPDRSCRWLVVGGGGGGGTDNGGGGGAGGFRTGTTDLTAATEYAIVIGAGGSASSGGNDSSLIGTGISVTSTAGGAGGASNGDGGAGGSGGGSSQNGGAGGAATSITPITGETTTVQGYAGGNATVGSTNGGGAGGGGASEVGTNISVATGANSAGDGGDGVASDITGSSVTYAGGGGGGGNQAAEAYYGDGGAGGGGRGGTGNNQNDAVAGTANLGAGGGGGGQGTGAGGGGGEGFVVVKMLDGLYASSTGSPTVDTSTVAGYTIIKFVDDGTFTTA